MKVCLFVAVALLTFASSEAARGITIPINLGPPGTLATDTTISFSDLNGTGLLGQSLSVDFVFTSSEFVRLFTVTSDFSVSMTLQTSSSSFVGFLHGTGYLTDSLGNALEAPETLGSASSSTGSMTVGLFPTVGRPLGFYDVHLDLTFPTNPAVVTGGQFRLFSDTGPFGIGPGLPTDIVPDTGSTAILLGLGFFGIILVTHSLDRNVRRHY
jgi:VPDSG-CTERM motif